MRRFFTPIDCQKLGLEAEGLKLKRSAAP